MEQSLPAHDPAEAVRLLGRIATVASTRIDAGALARSALLELVPAIGADGGALYLLDAEELVLVARIGFPGTPPEDTTRLPIVARTARLLAAGGVHQWTGGTVGDPSRRVLDESGARVVVSAVLTSAGARIGLLHVVRSTDEPFDDTCLALVGIVAGQLGAALDVARRRDADTTTRELSILQRNSMLVSKHLDLPSVLKSCLELTDELIAPDVVSIFIDDGTGERLQLVAQHRHPRGDEARYESLPRAAIAHLERDPGPHVSRVEDLAEPYRSTMARAGVTHTLSIPLLVDGALLGLLAMAFYGPHPVAASTMNSLVALAEQQATAIDRARAHALADRRARLADIVRTVAERALAAASTNEIADAILDGLGELIGGGAMRLGRVSSDGALRTVGRRLLPPVLDSHVFTDRHDASLAWLNALEGPVHVTSSAGLPAGSEFHELFENAHLRSHLILPLRRGDRLIGTLSAPSLEPRLFQPEELHAMRLLASIAATALDADRLRGEAETERRHLGQVLEMLPVPTSVTDAEGRFIQLNAMVRHLDEKARVGGTWQEGLVGVELARADGSPLPLDEMPLARALREGRDVPATEVRIRARHGWRSMMMQTTLLREDDGRVRAALSTAQDITALRELADAKNRFLGMATHELRSPLTALKFVTSRLSLDLDAAADPVRRHDFIDRILHQVDRLTRLIDDLHDAERLRDGTLALRVEPFDLGVLVRETTELAQLEAKGRTPVRVDIAGPVGGVWDRSRIAQVITNLVSNALRYSPEGAEVAVAVRRRADGWAELAVRDHGMGIPDAHKGRLFAPGVRGPGASRLAPGGAGLGLYIVDEIVRRHGGRIEVESEPGVGSCFKVALPIEPPAAPPGR